MRYIITALSLLFIVSIQAQKPEKLKTKTAKGPNGISEISCQVLKSDRKIKHGFYKEKKIFSTQLIESGFYSYGEKDGFWQEWYIISSSLKSKGVYSNGKKVGVWEYMNFRGELLHKYNHDTETVLFNNSCGKNKESQVLINEVQISKNLDCLPDALGGISSLYDATILSSFLEEKSNDTTTTVTINLDILIKKDGTIGKINIDESSFNPEYAATLKEALNNPELIWLPGELNGEKVDAYANYNHCFSY